jgi:serine protease inhibitor
MKNLMWLVFSAGLLLCGACAKEDIDKGPNDELTFDCFESPAVCALSLANNRFGFDLFRRFHEENPGDNLFISPTSISSALTMTANGARGATRDEMLKTMHLNGMSMDDINAANKVFLQTLPQLDAKVEATLANSIWYRQGFPVREDFLNLNAEYFASEVRGLDFNAPGAPDVINAWVSDKTKGRIKTIVGDIPGNAVMYLINAIYFKGDWQKSFDPKQTTDMPFSLSGGGEVIIPMMRHNGIRLPYLENNLFQAVDLPYNRGAFSMSVMLPKDGVSMNDLARQLSEGKWQEWAAGFAVDSIIFSMPKFKMEWENSLKGQLIDLGMGRAFDGGQADFSGIVDGGGLWIGEVKHKSFVEVNEQGTEAAAATSVMIPTSMPGIPIVTLDRPFVFLIRERGTNAVLFIGKMMNPAAG